MATWGVSLLSCLVWHQLNCVDRLWAYSARSINGSGADGHESASPRKPFQKWTRLIPKPLPAVSDRLPISTGYVVAVAGWAEQAGHCGLGINRCNRRYPVSNVEERARALYRVPIDGRLCWG